MGVVRMVNCFQSVKVIKFESNSQQNIKNDNISVDCFQSVKVIKFESNSQQASKDPDKGEYCFQSVKIIKFESSAALQSAYLSYSSQKSVVSNILSTTTGSLRSTS